MTKPLLKIPFTTPFPPPPIIPRSASTTAGALSALKHFLTASPSPTLHSSNTAYPDSTVVLTGAGISVSSGLADYRGQNGTYLRNKSYRPIYHHEFLSSHDARKRYWARSFLGWGVLQDAQPNSTHKAIKELGELGIVKSVITQNVDSFHKRCHPELETVELHGWLRTVVCVGCGNHVDRGVFQKDLERLNPVWSEFLRGVMDEGAVDQENMERRRGIKTNPDGDVDLPGAPYSTFKYPPCPTCLSNPHPPPIPSRLSPSTTSTTTNQPSPIIQVDTSSAWLPPPNPQSQAGILKPAVIMFGESIPQPTKTHAEHLIDSSSRLLVLGTSLATYSAWRLVKRARDRGMPVGIVNLGGVRGEEGFWDLGPDGSFDGKDVWTQNGELGVRINASTEELLPGLVEELKGMGLGFEKSKYQGLHGNGSPVIDEVRKSNGDMLKDMVS